MSHFIVTMPVDGLMFRPPESKVMPLPTSATDALGAAGAYDIVTIRGGFTEPWPTPTMPPKPPLTSAFSSSTDTVTFAAEAATRFLTLSANDCGKRKFGGVFTRSRAQSRAAPSTAARATASLAALPWPGARDDHDARTGAVAPAALARAGAAARPERRGLVVGVAPGVGAVGDAPTGSRGRAWAGRPRRCACRARCAGRPRRRRAGRRAGRSSGARCRRRGR